MPEPATSTAAVTAATTAAGLTLGTITGLQPDMLIAAVCGGVMAILTLREMTHIERIVSIVAALLTSATLGPVIVAVLPRLVPTLITAGDASIVRVAVGFLLGFLSYRVLLPSLMVRARSEIEGGEK